jgi:hypothetical protein
VSRSGENRGTQRWAYRRRRLPTRRLDRRLTTPFYRRAGQGSKVSGRSGGVTHGHAGSTAAGANGARTHGRRGRARVGGRGRHAWRPSWLGSAFVGRGCPSGRAAMRHGSGQWRGGFGHASAEVGGWRAGLALWCQRQSAWQARQGQPTGGHSERPVAAWWRAIRSATANGEAHACGTARRRGLEVNP